MNSQQYDDFLQLEQIVSMNEIDARWLLPFTIYRLNQLTDQREIDLQVTLSEIQAKPKTRRLRLQWLAETPTLLNTPVQEEMVTELAACGLTCAVLPLYTQFHLRTVAERGAGFDYWVGDGVDLLGIEVSGMIDGDVDSRRQQKIAQLLNSKHRVDGFVSVVNFSRHLVQLSFHMRGVTE